MFKYYNHLGFHNPYYTTINNNFVIEPSFTSILGNLPSKSLDFVAVTQILSTGYIFSDRTLIQLLNKSPWMAKPDADLAKWSYYKIPKHSERIEDEEIIAKHFYTLLKEELYTYLKGHTNIGILLTGGMDSRIVACVLNELIVSGEVKNKKILGLTWGFENSRDVIYAKQICKIFDWDWEHVKVDAEQMWDNMKICIENGCEYTPIHLHGMSKVARRKDIDCVLAGSFGDSVGRAEFSGIKVADLSDIRNKIRNPAHILRKDFLKWVIPSINLDVEKYHQRFPQSSVYMLYEQDQQIHYMRRMLNACMSIINRNIPLYQMFSSPQVYGYMWSLHPKLRNDRIYEIILKSNNMRLAEIPWARTGLLYPSKKGTPDAFLKRHHDYGKMIRTEFLSHIENTIFGNLQISEKLFNTISLKTIIRNLRKYPIENNYTLEEKLLWISTLIDFIKYNNVKLDFLPYKNTNTFVSYIISDLNYKSRYLFKKIKRK